ncbi:MAG: methyltransferase [Rhodospirillaceae bacterium]|nr:methyltransferase [Rhodospirillaceae bacterium]HAA91364.1 methyltransferase [Rhodospirillaceae bacterium]
MNALADSLKRRIAAEGPISIAAFMAEALMHPEHGYYAKADPLGAEGDFTTAPEISQVFGELIGLWCAEMWRAGGAPSKIAWVELGPGRGTLMADALRAAAVLPEFLEAAEIHLVEASPALRRIQEQTLAEFKVAWHDSVATLPEMPALVVANEFFDALPIHQFRYTERGWCEHLVGVANDEFALVVSPDPSPRARLIAGQVTENADIGDVTELCPAAFSIIETISADICAHGGAALIVDYGEEATHPVPTLQSVQGHEPHNFLEAPGSADITAHLDFGALKRAVTRGAECWGPITQRDFLLALGLEARAARLSASATPGQQAAIENACHRLIAENEMGTLFKALAITAGGGPVPPAF